jgi:hypothetical protein
MGGKRDALFFRSVLVRGALAPDGADLAGNRKRDRDLLAFPRGKFADRFFCGFDREPAVIDVEHAPELALGDEDRAGVHPADNKRFVQRAHGPARDHIEDRDLAFVVDHREVARE